MTIKEAILKSLEDLHKLLTHNEIFKHIISQKYYDFGEAKTPASTISVLLGDKRIKGKQSQSLYYLAKFEQDLNINEIVSEITKKSQPK